MTAIIAPEPVGAVGRARNPGIRSGRYYPTFSGALGSTSAVPAVDTIYAYPFIVTLPIAVTSINVRVATGGAGSSVKMALWANSPSLALPVGAPIAVQNTGQSTASNNSTATGSVSLTLVPGIYWAGSKFTGTLPQCVAMLNSSCDVNVLLGRSSFTSQAVTCLSVADTFSNNMPTLTGGESWSDNVTAGAPFLWLGT